MGQKQKIPFQETREMEYINFTEILLFFEIDLFYLTSFFGLYYLIFSDPLCNNNNNEFFDSIKTSSP